MSWLSAVTGKAEDLLNKLDRSAADVFHIEEETAGVTKKPVTLSPLALSGQPSQPAFPSSKPLSPSPSLPSRLSDTSRFGQPTTSSTPKPTTKSSSLSSTGAVKAASAGPAASKPAGVTVKKKDSDEALFDFLNSKEPSEGAKKRVTPISSRHHSRQSSTSSLRGSGKTAEGGDELPSGEGNGGEGIGSSASAAQAQATTASMGESFVEQKFSCHCMNLNLNLYVMCVILCTCMHDNACTVEHPLTLPSHPPEKVVGTINTISPTQKCVFRKDRGKYISIILFETEFHSDYIFETKCTIQKAFHSPSSGKWQPKTTGKNTEQLLCFKEPLLTSSCLQNTNHTADTN